MKTEEQIVERVQQLVDSKSDWMGFEISDLIGALSFDAALPWLKPEATADDWEVETEEELRNRATDYLTFAFEKAQSHRGLSASRSVSHFNAWLWLLDILPEDWEDIEYAQYGVPKLFAAARALGRDVPTDEDLVRMSQGLPCEPNCYEGCGT